MKFEEKLVFVSGGQSNYRIPSLITTKKGTALAFCNDRKGTLDDHAQVASLCLVRKEAGKDWESVREIRTLEGYHFLIGCAVYDENTDTAFIFGEVLGASVYEFGRYSEDELALIRKSEREKAEREGVRLGDFILKSRDDGLTWECLSVEFDKAEYTHNGRALKAQGRTHGCAHGITLRHGKYAGRLLCPSRIMDIERYSDSEGLRKSVYNNAVYSDDHGLTWKTSTPVQLGTGEGTLIEREDGSILYNSRAYFDDELRYLATSTDGGANYGDFRTDDFLREPRFGCNASFIRIELDELSDAERALLPDEARDVTVFVNPRASETRKNLSACVSFDGGETYSHVKLITDQPSAYSSLAYSSATSSFYLIYEKGESPDMSNPYKLGIAGAEFDLEWLLSK